MAKIKWQGTVIVSDHDRGVISVHGPMTDDTGITNATAKEQAKGRKINCCSGSVDYMQAIAEAKQMQPTYKLIGDALDPDSYVP